MTSICDRSGHKHAMTGALSGLIEVPVTHPIDYAKIVLQNSKTGQSNYQVLRSIVQTNGFRTFYTGLLPRWSGVVPMRMIFWGTQTYCNQMFPSYGITSPGFQTLMASGLIAGAVQTFIDAPIETIKVRRMTGGVPVTLKTVYKGYWPNLYRNMFYAAVVNSFIHYGTEGKEITKFENFVRGGLGGVVASVSTQPIDYVKTEQQAGSTESMYKIMKNVYRQNPFRLFRGVVPRSTVSLFSMGIGGVVSNLDVFG